MLFFNERYPPSKAKGHKKLELLNLQKHMKFPIKEVLAVSPEIDRGSTASENLGSETEEVADTHHRYGPSEKPQPIERRSANPRFAGR